MFQFLRHYTPPPPLPVSCNPPDEGLFSAWLLITALLVGVSSFRSEHPRGDFLAVLSRLFPGPCLPRLHSGSFLEKPAMRFLLLNRTLGNLWYIYVCVYFSSPRRITGDTACPFYSAAVRLLKSHPPPPRLGLDSLRFPKSPASPPRPPFVIFPLLSITPPLHLFSRPLPSLISRPDCLRFLSRGGRGGTLRSPTRGPFVKARVGFAHPCCVNEPRPRAGKNKGGVLAERPLKPVTDGAKRNGLRRTAESARPQPKCCPSRGGLRFNWRCR